MADRVVAGDGMGESAQARIVNMSELAFVLEVSLPTLRDLIKRHEDFPVKAHGDNGVAYEFDLDDVKGWLARHEAAKAEADDRRQADLKQYRLKLFGESSEGDATTGMSPAERKAEVEAQFRADQLARLRGELLVAAEVDRVLGQAMAEMGKGIRRIGSDVAREHGLERDVRIAIDAGIRDRFNGLIDRVQALLRDEDISDAA